MAAEWVRTEGQTCHLLRSSSVMGDGRSQQRPLSPQSCSRPDGIVRLQKVPKASPHTGGSLVPRMVCRRRRRPPSKTYLKA